MAIQAGQSLYDPIIHPDTKHSGLVALARLSTNMTLKSFQRDTSLATGTQAVTGIGFTPKVVIFLAVVPATSQVSIGLDDGTIHLCLRDIYVSGAGQWDSDSQAIHLKQGASDYYLGSISSLDADGFTLSWVKGGSKTGTANIQALCIK